MDKRKAKPGAIPGSPLKGRGRPKGEDRFSLVESGPHSYSPLKELLSYLPDHVRDRILSSQLSREQGDRMNSRIRQLGTGIWSVFPMICTGDRCPYRGRCPLQTEGMAPDNESCPLEAYLMTQYMTEYMKALNVLQTDKVEMDQIGTVVMCDMIIMRIRNYMARRPDGHIDESPIGVDDSGNIILKRDISKEILIEEKYQKIKDKLLESLLATREVRAKYNIIDENDPGVKAAKLRFRAQELKSKKIKDADMEEARITAQAEFYEDVAKTMEVSQLMIDAAGPVKDNSEGLGIAEEL